MNLPAATEDALFRGAQEALRNVERHAEPNNVDVGVAVSDGRATLTVTDDGKGFVPGNGLGGADTHFGLRLLADLAAECGGTLAVDSAVGQGTTVKMEVPI